MNEKELRARNVLSTERFQFDLQRFGHHGGGKSRGKLFVSILFGVAGFIWAGPLFSAKCWAGAIMGASLGGSIWTATHQNSLDMGETGSPDVQRFDRAQEQMSSNGQIPVVYGMRKIAGNQTYHWTNAEANQFHKHVVLCEGGIEGIVSITANDLLIPTGKQSEGAVFTIQNRLDKDAIAGISDKHLYLQANGHTHDVYLCNKDDGQSNGSFYEWQVNISSLVAYINRMHDGWECFPTAATNKYPGDLSMPRHKCYLNPLKATCSTVTGGTNYTFHDCDTPSNYDEVGGYPSLAWLDMYFNVSSELNGNPTIAAIVKGKKVYDLRTKETAYSTNPAMCLLDFLTNKRYGLGRYFSLDDIDEDSWKEAADYCDEMVTFQNSDGFTQKAKRYELNMVIDQKSSGMNWVQEILSNFGGYLTISNGKVKLKIEKQTPVSYRFDESNSSDLSISPIRLSETPNRYTVKIVDPLNNWTSVSCLCEDYADQKQRGKIVNKEIQLNGVSSQNQALRLARFYRDYNLACPLNISFKTGLQAMHLEPGDVVTISYRGVFKDLPIRISEIKESEDGSINISGRQYNDTLYTDDLGGGIHWYNYTSADATTNEDSPLFILKNVKNLKAVSQFRRKEDGKTAYDIVVTFDLPSVYNITKAKVYYKQNNAPVSNVGVIAEGVPVDEIGYTCDWTCAGEATSRLVIPDVKIGDEYVIRVTSCAKNEKETVIDDAPEVTCKVVSKELIPPCPHGLIYDFSHSFHFSWQDLSDVDLLYYEIRTDTNKGSQNGLLGRTVESSADVVLTKREGTVYVYAVNSQNAYSYPTKCDYKYSQIEAPESITFKDIPRGCSIELPEFPASAVGAKIIVTDSSAEDTIETKNRIYVYQKKTGVFKVRACYVDLMGDGKLSEEFTMSVNPVFNKDWIEDGSLSIDKVDAKIKDAIKNAQDSVDKFKDVDSTIQKNSDSIVSIVGNLSKSPEESGYSALTQLKDAVDLRVKKGEVISEINLSPEGATINGKYLHITGDTKFDKDVSIDGMLHANAVSADMIQANAITSEKIASKAITTDKLAVKSLSAITATIGTLQTKETGARTVIKDNLIEVYDENNTLRVRLGVWE